MATDTEPAVELLDGAASRDAGLVEELTGLINDVYATAERGLWRDGATRTTTTAASTTPIRIWRAAPRHTVRRPGPRETTGDTTLAVIADVATADDVVGALR